MGLIDRIVIIDTRGLAGYGAPALKMSDLRDTFQL
ncbi:hypothetical protein SNOG_06973 [Parastagonospora nodorum SN15]|uniref:Uncharacterized protein n=1 Tax=Phaeosphaeria nodorum (strain SN15 / ATCC MYA-4574 / FGSC 10173) TaxID=321614 RepID=Q0UMP1_PHANO|nr:hypothetical protein SNOG_06973 [Parastagonospora nodorum SN15]EAT85624.1 hypothetical protein SNOG_06973 [Parastagonospora nodorum SN15]